MASSAVRAALAGCLLCAGCGAGEVRGEVVLWIDTDLGVPAQVDTLRIEVFSPEDGAPIDGRLLTLATSDRWPVSLGLAAADATSEPSFRVRLTAYAARAILDPLADESEAGAAQPPSCPPGIEPEPAAPLVDEASIPVQPAPLPQYATTRLVDVRVQAGELVGRRVVLRAACLGAIPDAASDDATCIDGSEGSPDSGVESAPLEALPTAAGSAPALAPAPCAGPDVPGIDGRVCVPGGFGYLGDAREPPAHVSCPACNDLPPVPVVVRPFFMDRYEVTVGRLHDALHAGDATTRFVPASPLPEKRIPGSPSLGFCTWPGDGLGPFELDDVKRRLPVACVTWTLADEFCRWAGGSLPSEAQWYFAATGRGEGLRFPWGDEPPTSCADASYGLYNLPCGEGVGPEPVDAHPHDSTAEGIIGLAGLMREFCADLPGPISRPGCRRSSSRGLGALAYTGAIADDGPCQCAGSVRSPEFESEELRLSLRVVRGAEWGSLEPSVRARTYATTLDAADEAGFRCVYPAEVAE